MTPKSQAPKPKMNKRDYLKPKSFFTAKEAIKKMIRQPLKWEKIFIAFAKANLSFSLDLKVHTSILIGHDSLLLLTHEKKSFLERSCFFLALPLFSVLTLFFLCISIILLPPSGK